MNIRPLYDPIVVKRMEEQETARNGIAIPDSAREKPQEGQVMAIGKGKQLDDGKMVALDVKEGARILFSKYSGNEIKLGGVEEPVRQLVMNCGTEGAVVVDRIRASKESKYGFNASIEQYEDLVKAGVIDPTKVTRTALQNAASIASLMLTTEAMVSESVEQVKAWMLTPASGKTPIAEARS